MKQKVTEKLNSDFIIIENAIDYFRFMQNPTKINTYYQLKVVEYIFAFFCQGVQLRAPEPYFLKDGRFSLLYDITKERLWNVDKWCHDPEGQMFNLDPRVIFQDEEKKQYILEKMKNATEAVLFHPQLEIDIKTWTYYVPLVDNSQDPVFGRDYMPKFLMYVTHYYVFEEWCKDNFKDIDPTKCLSAFLHYK